MTTWEEIARSTPMCGEFVSWWGGEYEGNCERPPDHENDHFDGMSWFNEHGEEGEPDPSYDVSAGPNARWQRERSW
jgi:hypothetical protein